MTIEISIRKAGKEDREKNTENKKWKFIIYEKGNNGKWNEKMRGFRDDEELFSKDFINNVLLLIAI